MAQKEDSPILGRYKLYKAGTARLVQWVARTASGCCDITSIVKALRTDPARKAAPKAPLGATVDIRTRELVTLANIIASAKPPVAIPTSILEVARDVITGITVCAEWYASQTFAEHSAEQNDGHAYFIGILREVRDILSSAQSVQSPLPGKANSKKRKDGVSTKDGLTNLFACLEIEEPSDAPLGKAAKAKPAKATSMPARRETKFNLKDEAEDMAFEIWCLLQDLDDVRAFVCDTWAAYAKGHVSLMTTGMVTETAFGMMRRANEEFVAGHPECADYVAVMDFWKAHYQPTVMSAMGQAASITPPYSPELLVAVNSGLLLCVPAAILIRVFEEHAQNYRRELLATRHEIPEGGVLFAPKDVDPRAKFHHLGSVLLHLAPEIVDYTFFADRGRYPNPSRMAEEFVRGLASITRGGATPLWLVVACQTYMDIFDLVKNRPGVGADCLIEHLQTASDTLICHREFIKKYKKEGFMGVWDEHFGRLMKQTEDAALFMIDMRQAAQTGDDEAMAWTMLLLPVMASRKAYVHRIEMLHEGMMVANSGFVILCLAHFYKAARHYGLVTTAWHDMDFIIAQHSGKQAYVTKVNASADAQAMARHFQIALGQPASSFARSQKPKVPWPGFVVRHARKMTATSPFVIAFTAGVGTANELDFDRGEVVDVVLQSMTENAATVSGSDSKSPARSSPTSQQHYTPLQLLSTLKKNLIADEPQLNFDYFTYYQSCANLLQGVIEIVQVGVPAAARCPPNPLYEVVDRLLWEAAEAVTSGQPLGPTRFGRAAAFLQIFIEEDGKRFSKAAYDQSSGRIPKHKRPDFAPG
ncbi:hypothetical protein LTR85_007465 [Meristemomyces frigidus]|nr:hypothetical protein LTR85_007465 [Meristemomyces frigidus]